MVLNNKQRFEDIVKLIKEDEAIKYGKPIIGFLEISIKIFHFLNQNTHNGLISSLCDLFIECIKNDAYSQNDWDYSQIGLPAEEEQARSDMLAKAFKEGVADFLKSEKGQTRFILTMLHSLDYEPFKCIESYISEGYVLTK